MDQSAPSLIYLPSAEANRDRFMTKEDIRVFEGILSAAPNHRQHSRIDSFLRSGRVEKFLFTSENTNKRLLAKKHYNYKKNFVAIIELVPKQNQIWRPASGLLHLAGLLVTAFSILVTLVHMGVVSP